MNRAPPITKTLYRPAPPPKRQVVDGTQWRCSGCNKDLFGIFKGGKLHIRYRERDLMAQGLITVICRKCGLSNSLDTLDVDINIIQTTDDNWAQPLMIHEVNATDQAIELAKELGVNLLEIEGSGREGRILIGDVRVNANS